MEIKPYDKNAKKHPEKQLEQIKNSILAFGFKQPIVVDKSGVIIAGHGRYMAATQLLGWKTYTKAAHAPKGETYIPYLVADDLSADEVKAYRLADNKLNESAWDMEMVIPELRNLTDDLLELSGFSQDDIASAEWNEAAKQSLREDFIIPPFSVWDTKQTYWRKRREAWTGIFGDSREGRDKDLLGKGMSQLARKQSVNTNLTGTSEFDPVIAEISYKWFNTPKGKILDPFAGGVVRGAVAGVLGYDYTGIDLSKKQIETNKNQLKKAGLAPVNYLQGNSKNLDKLLPKNTEYDFIFSCPPYYDLEQYSDDPEDLSNKASYADFIAEYREAIKKAVQRLKNNRFAVFVVGDIRDKQGYYQGFTMDTIRAFEDAGMRFYNDIVLLNAIATAPMRARRPFSENRKVAKVHQNILAFYKGDPEEINNQYINLPKVERMHHNVVVFYKGSIDQIKNDFKIVMTDIDAGGLEPLNI